MRPLAPAPVALVLLMALPACTSVSDPKLKVVTAEPAGRSDEGVALVFTLDASNENPTGLPLRTVRYTVELDGREVFSGTRSPEATLRRLGTQQITLPAVVRLADHPNLGNAARVPYRINGELTYVAPGQIAELLFDANVRVPTTTFSGSGEVDLGG